METKFVSRIFRFGDSRAVILPAKMIKAQGWHEGDFLAFFIIDKNVIKIQKLKVSLDYSNV